jgi:flagellar FliL protein
MHQEIRTDNTLAYSIRKADMNLFKSLAISFLLGSFLLIVASANAEEGGSKAEGSEKDLLAKVAYIIVNLQGPTQKYIQVEMILKLAKPELAEKAKLYMPVIRNKMILLLSGKTAGQLESRESKLKLVKESKNAINEGLELTGKEGVTEVFFTSFIIQ